MSKEYTLINTINKGGAIKAREVCMMVDMYPLAILTKFVVTGMQEVTTIGGSSVCPFKCIPILTLK